LSVLWVAYAVSESIHLLIRSGTRCPVVSATVVLYLHVIDALYLNLGFCGFVHLRSLK
jgi:hypothetical protein